MSATTLNLIFNADEDRLVLLLGPQAPGLLLTRRLTARLVNGFATVLEKSSLPASAAPDEMRDSIISMEHLGAITGAFEGGSDVAAQPVPQKVTAHLVSNVTIAVHPTLFALTITAVGVAPLALNLNRVDLYRLTDLLRRQADAAGWDLPIDAPWLSGDTSLLTIN